MMYSLKELNARLDYLKSISRSGGAKLIEELRDAIKAYLARDSNFELQVNKTLDKVIADAFHHNLKYEHQELIEPWQERKGEPPTGYDNVADLFKGNEIFEEIMTVKDFDFIAAFYTETKDDSSSGGGGGSNVSTEYHNRLTEAWVAALKKAVSDELESLKAIMQYCANSSYSVEFAVLFEEHGNVTNKKSVKDYAKEIFVTKSYGWLIKTFNLNVYCPSYMTELEAD